MKRIRCSRCGESVSGEIPSDVVIRAFVECPECIEKQPDKNSEIAVLKSERDNLQMYHDCTINQESARKNEIATLKERVRELEAKVNRWTNDVNITEAALGISGLYATKDKQIDKYEAENQRLREALEEALDDGGHAIHCCARKGPYGEGWIEEEYCSCWNKHAREALKEISAEPLGHEFEKVLYKNLGRLYEEEAKDGSETT